MGAGFGSFVDGLFAGSKSMTDLRKQADDLKTSMLANQLSRQGVTTALAAGQQQPTTPLPSGSTQAPFGGTTGSTGAPSTTSDEDPTIEGAPLADSGGKGDNPSAGQLYDYFIGTGASANEAALLTAQANIESSFNADATHDGGIGYGLWGHNKSRLSAMYSYAGLPSNSAPGTKVPWQQQADFALNELRNRPEGALVNGAKTPQQLNTLGMAFEQPGGWTAQNPQAGNAWDQRLAATTNYMQHPPHYIPPQQPQTQTAGPAPGTMYPNPNGPQPFVTTPPGQQTAGAPPPAAPPPTALQPPQTVEGSPVVAPPAQPAAYRVVDPAGSMQPARPVSAVPVNWNPYGDSIAMGFIESGYPGTYAASNGAVNTTQNAVGGRNPQQVLARLNSIPDKSLNGAPILLSSGASNVGVTPGTQLDDYHLNLIDQQVKSLKRAGAGQIMLLGVGDHGGRESPGGTYFDLHNINPQLQKIAADNNIGFSGALTGAVVHPSPGYYKSRFRNTQRASRNQQGSTG